MKTMSKKIYKTVILAAAAVLLIVVANICEFDDLPAFIKKPFEQANSATGNMLYRPNVETDGLDVSVFDVGQGDSIYINCEGKSMLIDAGIPEEGEKVCSKLSALGVTKIDYLVCTHPHNDHIGGMPEVIRKFDIGDILMSDADTTTDTYLNLLNSIKSKGLSITIPKPGYCKKLGGAEFTVLSPKKQYSDLNDNSVVIKLIYNNNSFLFMGDAGAAAEKDILSDNSDLSADVLKVGHHGSASATTEEFLKEVHPSFAVISVGEDNSYGLPDNTVTQRLRDAGISTFRTDKSGTVIFHSDGKKITVEKEK